MIAVVAVLRVQEDKVSEFEAIFRDLTAKVRANEPGNLVYQLARSRTEPNTYKVLELYRDSEAVEAHRNAEYFKAAGGAMAACFAAKPEIDRLDAVV